MISATVYVAGRCIENFLFDAIPRDGELIYCSLRKVLEQESRSPGTYTEDSVKHWRECDGLVLQVQRVAHEVQYTGSPRVTIHCKRMAADAWPEMED